MKAVRLSAMCMGLCGLWLASGCATTRIPPPVVDRQVDLERFMGPWYVVAGQFTWLEREAWNGIESYELEADGTIATTYTFRKGGVDGPLKSYHPSAIVVDRKSNAEWGMQFLWPFRATFLILFLDDDYRYTVIGEPDRKYLWIMARDPVIPDDMMKTITQRLTDIGYDPAKFVRMPQQWPESGRDQDARDGIRKLSGVRQGVAMQEFRLIAIVLAIGLALVILGCRATRSGYESAPYKLVRSDGKFEVRDYPALMVVETAMERGGQDGDGSFNRLFGFITGKNEAKQKIAMTAPVLMSGGDSNRTMAFVLPSPMKSGAVPKPADGAVTVRELPAGRFAVLRFSGARSAEQEAAALGKLQAWMAAQGLKASSPPVYGYFDPPWTPSVLRRNEVMLQAEPGT